MQITNNDDELATVTTATTTADHAQSSAAACCSALLQRLTSFHFTQPFVSQLRPASFQFTPKATRQWSMLRSERERKCPILRLEEQLWQIERRNLHDISIIDDCVGWKQFPTRPLTIPNGLSTVRAGLVSCGALEMQMPSVISSYITLPTAWAKRVNARAMGSEQVRLFQFISVYFNSFQLISVHFRICVSDNTVVSFSWLPRMDVGNNSGWMSPE